MDKDCIDKLIALGTDPASIARIQDLAAKEMERAGLGYTMHKACAATLSEFLNAAGIPVPITLGAGMLARRLEKDRGWVRVAIGNQIAGDVGVTEAVTPPPGADHVYLVVERIDSNMMMIADNQSPVRHKRLVKGGGKTPTEYFLRAPDGAKTFAMPPRAIETMPYPEADEETNNLKEPFQDDGLPV